MIRNRGYWLSDELIDTAAQLGRGMSFMLSRCDRLVSAIFK